MKRSQEYIDVRPDRRIVLYQRPGLKNPYWQARIRVPKSKGYKIVSTGTNNLDEAKYYALQLFDELTAKVRSGGSVRSPPFDSVFKEWKQWASRENTRYGGAWTSTSDRIECYALQFFKDMPIDTISSSVIQKYWDWRSLNYKRRKPSGATLRREKTCLATVFNFARKRGYLSALPEFDVPRGRGGRRATFTVAEWAEFCRAAATWAEEGEGKSTARDRAIAVAYFHILAETGLRVGELRKLEWGHLREMARGKGYLLVATVTGKTGQREVIFQPGSERHVRALYELFCKERGAPPNRADYVVASRDGDQIVSFRRSFHTILNMAGLSKARAGLPRTIYSLRHYYATRRLEEGRNPYLVAKQMRTSVEMIEKHYEHLIVNEATASHLAPEINESYSAPRPFPFR